MSFPQLILNKAIAREVSQPTLVVFSCHIHPHFSYSKLKKSVTSSLKFLKPPKKLLPIAFFSHFYCSAPQTLVYSDTN